LLRKPKEEDLVKITALFGHPHDPEAFEEYYAQTHTPLIQSIPNLQRFDRGKIIGTPDGSRPPYYRIADLWFSSIDQLQASLATPQGQQAAQDLQNFATGGVSLFISVVSE
jgi:uncharacterized protein (TIGR02118 family)